MLPRPWQRFADAWTFAIAACLPLAALSALVVAPAPAYDPWAWLLWGREVVHGTLNTAEGPAFKPLPVALTAPLSLLGDDAAPIAWVVLARAAAFAAVWLAFVVGRRLGGVAGGLLAAAGVALCGAFPTYAATGDVTGLFLALVLGGVLAWWDGRFGLVLACAIGCALLRVEAWPFAAVAGAVLLPRAPHLRVPMLLGVLLVPAAWLVPEWLGSGDLTRSGDRARIPNPGQPAEADAPVLASLEDALGLALWPLLAAAVALAVVLVRLRAGQRPPGALPAGAARSAGRLAAAGAAWIALVAVMAGLGFSGEARYALPGAALLAVAGAIVIAGLPRPLLAVAAALVAIAAVPRVADLADLRDRQAHQWRLAEDLRDAVSVARREFVLDCGTPYVGPYRGPLLAYRLDVAKEDVEPDARPRPPGVVFRSRRRAGDEPEPSVDGFQRLWRSGTWEVAARCG